MLKKVVAIAAGLTVILGLVYLLFPRLKPKPDPEKYGATLKVLSVEPNVTFETELSRLEVARLGGSGKYREKYRHSTGAVIRFECTVKGKKDTNYPIQWTMYDATTKTALAERDFHYQSAWPTSGVIQKGSEAQLAGDVWVPYPKRAGSFFIRLDLIDPDTRRAMAYAESPPFDVS